MRSDERIKKQVVDSLYWDDRVDASEVTVSIEDGRVELSGSVPSYTAKLAARDDAWLVEGVKSIDDQLEVIIPPTPSVPSDEDVRESIMSALRWDPELYSFKMDVDVKAGWVTMEGTVDAYWKKIRAERVITDVWGVLGVTNKLAVVPEGDITDERIAEDIIDAIDRNLNIDVDRVNVKVENGQVTLTGTVSSLAAKSAAYDAALYTIGVRDVMNNLIVEPITEPAMAR